jgi:hypothetical protein
MQQAEWRVRRNWSNQGAVESGAAVFTDAHESVRAGTNRHGGEVEATEPTGEAPRGRERQREERGWDAICSYACLVGCVMMI